MPATNREVLSFPDDLSHGPIAWSTARERAAWWSQIHAPLPEEELTTFWHRLETADERLVVWFGRHSAGDSRFSWRWPIGWETDPMTSSRSASRTVRSI